MELVCTVISSQMRCDPRYFNFDHFGNIESIQFSPAVALLICHDSLPCLPVFEVAIEMSMSKRPELDILARPAYLMREIRDECRPHLCNILQMPRIIRRLQHCWAMVSEHHNLAVRFVSCYMLDLRIEPADIGLVCSIVRINGLILYFGEIRAE